MHGWQRPLGPESVRTYWIRRALIIAAAVVVVGILLGGVLRSLARPAPAVDAPPPPTSPASLPPRTPTAAGSASPTAPSLTPTALAASPSPSASATPTPGPCSAAQMQVAITGERQPRSGETLPWKVAVTNVSDTSCHVEVTPDSAWITVTSGAVRVWSTQDCGEWLAAPPARWLEPGAAVEWTVEWPTKFSSAGCHLGEQYLKPGTYVAHARYADAAEASLVIALRG